MRASDEGVIWDFDNWADDYDEQTQREEGLLARYREVLDRVIEAAHIAPGMRVLDLGTGTGALAFRCLAKGAQVIGLDPSQRMLQMARHKAGCNYRVRFVLSHEPFERIGYPDGHFDAVISSYAFHHVPRSKQPHCIEEMMRVLAPGGYWAIGDLIFEDAAAESTAVAEYDWLEQEYFPLLDEVRPVFDRLGMELHAEQMTPVTWVLWAQKPAED